MKQYPEIPRSTGTSFMELPGAYIFDKLDGRHVRVEWSKKRGFYKYGTRHHLFDHTDPDYAPAITHVGKYFAEKLERIFVDNRWESVVAFFELWQDHSLGGTFNTNEIFHLTLLDVSPYKMGLMKPKQFVEMFEDVVDTPKLLSVENWNRHLIEAIRMNELPGITFEGAVGKSWVHNSVVMSKAKTQQWRDAIMDKYGAVKGTELVNS